MAQDRGWVDPAALRSVYASLPPQLSLAQALVQRGLLQPAQAQALLQELGAHQGATVQLPAGASPTVQLPAGGASPTVQLPAGGASPTFHLAPGSPPPMAGTARWAPGESAQTLPPPASGRYVPPSDANHTLPLTPPGPGSHFAAQAPGLAQSGSGSSMDAATLMGGPPAQLSSSGTGALPQPGEVMAGRYGIVRVLGQGGMGAVYLADDRQRGTQVALKVMLPGAAGEQALIRFQREAEALAKVDDHVGIVRIRDYGVEAGLPYAALDLIEGGDLHDRIKAEGPLPVAEAVRVTAEVAKAIHHCHERSILHRDLKPANVMVRTADGAPFVTDFGLAYDAEEEAERLTQTGQVMGTPAYMPPEQAEGDKEHIDERSDVYGLGAILYELLAGEAPFRGDGMAIIKKVLLDEPQDLHERRPEVPPDLARIQQKAMAKDPALRYASAAELAADLERFERGEPIQARPPTRAERQRWRRKQGDKRAIAAYVGVRFLLPIALVLGLALSVFWFRPWERYLVSAALGDHVPQVLSQGLVFPGDKGAGELNSQATQLASHLAKIHRVEGLDQRPSLALRQLLEREDVVSDPAERALLRSYSIRLDVASGLTLPEIPEEGDPEAPTLRLLRTLRFGADPADAAKIPALPAPPEGAPKSLLETLEVAQRVESYLETHEERGWKKAIQGGQGAWSTGDLERRLGSALKAYGGVDRWRSFCNDRLRRTKLDHARGQLRRVIAAVDKRRADRRMILSSCGILREHLEAEPRVDSSLVDEEFLRLGETALVRMQVKAVQDIKTVKGMVELFSDPQVADLVDWERVKARIEAKGVENIADSLARPYIKGGLMPTNVLVLCLRLGTRHATFVNGRFKHYAAELERLIAARKDKGGASRAAYLLLADCQNLLARQTDVDRANPEIILKIVTSLANTLGPDLLPIPKDLYPLDLQTPQGTLEERWTLYAKARLFTHLSDYEHYRLEAIWQSATSEEARAERAKARPKEDNERMHALSRAGLAWFAREGPQVSIGEQANSIGALARSAREASLFLPKQDALELRDASLSGVDLVIEALLAYSERISGKGEKVEVQINQLDQGLDPEHLQRNLCGLLEAYYVVLQKIDYPRCLKRVREVHQRYQANIGTPSPYLYKASIQLSLGMEQWADAKVEIEDLLEFYARVEAGKTTVSYDDLPERVDGVEGWYAQALIGLDELSRAREIYARAQAKGGGTHKHWKQLLSDLRGE